MENNLNSSQIMSSSHDIQSYAGYGWSVNNWLRAHERHNFVTLGHISHKSRTWDENMNQYILERKMMKCDQCVMVKKRFSLVWHHFHRLRPRFELEITDFWHFFEFLLQKSANFLFTEIILIFSVDPIILISKMGWIMFSSHFVSEL